eukprot:jgi/Psemu1/18328/gm1.18328_g
MESDADDTPIPMLRIGRNESSTSGNISSLRRRSCSADDADANKEEDADEANADADATATIMMLTHNELDRDGEEDSDEEGSLAAAFDIDAADIDNNSNNELYVGMQDGYYYYKDDGTQVEETTTYSKPPQDYSPSDSNKSKLGEPSWHDVDNPGAWDQFCYQSKFEKEYKEWMFHCQNWVPEEDTPTFSVGTPPVETSSPKKGKASLIWLSLGSMDFNLEEYLTVMLYSSTSSFSPSIQMKRMRNKQTACSESPSTPKC